MAFDATRRKRLGAVVGLLVAACLATSCWSSGTEPSPRPAPEPPPPAVVGGASTDRFVGLSPARVLDTRPGEQTIDGTFAGMGPSVAGGVTELRVAGRGGVSSAAVAVVLNLTATASGGAGYVTAWPCGAPRPLASNVNYHTGVTVPNLVAVKVGQGGAVCLASAGAPVHLIADVAGYFAAGGFEGLVPARLLDTRPGGVTVDGLDAGGGARAGGSTTRLTVTGRGGVAADAGGVVLNVTAADAAGPGFVTAWPCNRPRPLASNLNFAAGPPRPNLVLQGLGPGEQVCLYTEGAPVHLIADVSGYVPGGSPLAGLTPARLLDTRAAGTTVDGAFAGGPASPANGVTELRVNGRGGVAPDAAAVVLNITATESEEPGYLTAWPCGEPRPLASNLNYVAGDTVPNLAVVKVGADGNVCLFTAGSTVQLVLDVAGQLAAPAPAGPAPVPQGVPGAWALRFAEEFDGSTVDASRWSPCYAHGDWYGCSSGELQWYLPENVRLGAGTVQLVGEDDPFQVDHDPPRFMSHRSGMLSTLRHHHWEADKFTFRYGFVEFRARLPRGRGLWPALWLSSAGGGREEIDVLENHGHDPTTLFQTVHWPAGEGGDGDLRPYQDGAGTDFSAGMHTYGLDWQPDHIAWYVDGELARETFTDGAKIPQVDMGLIANLAIGGDWPCRFVPAPCPDPASFPAQLAIDYVRVWQRR